jgi:hypothetical protein
LLHTPGNILDKIELSILELSISEIVTSSWTDDEGDGDRLLAWGYLGP